MWKEFSGKLKNAFLVASKRYRRHLNHGEHLVFADEAVVIDIVHGVSPTESLLEGTSRCDRQREHELLEVQAAVGVGIESSEKKQRRKQMKEIYKLNFKTI